MSKWKDVTSYSRDGDRKPHWWAIELGSIRLSVGDTQIGLEPGEYWFAYCTSMFGTRQLKATNKKEAQQEALLMVKRQLDPVWSALAEALNPGVETDKA